MKKQILYLAAAAVLLVTGCNRGGDDNGLAGGYGKGEGAIALNIKVDASSRSVSATESVIEKMAEHSVLKIYDAADNLVRRYEPATEAPDQIYILGGDYTATLLIGDKTPATFDSSKWSFFGTSKFTVEAKSTSQINLDCKMINTAVQVTFDETIGDNFDGGYSVKVVSADSYTTEAYEAEDDVKLEFTESGVGYFIIPEGEEVSKNLAWEFAGVKTLGGVSTPITMKGVIAAPAAQNMSTLKFSYSNYLRVDKDSFSITIDKDLDIFDDGFSFKPQPTIKGVGFELSDKLYANADIQFDIKGLSEIAYIELQDGDKNYVVYSSNKTPDAPGASYSVTTLSSGVLTVSPEFFKVFAKGGDLDLGVKVIDKTNSSGEENVTVVATGITTLSGADYWKNTATISALILDEEATSVTIDYRNVGSTEWVSAAATKVGDNTYSAMAVPQWATGTNDGNDTTYTLVNGISSGNSYECRLTIDGEVYPSTILKSADASQKITNGTINSSLACFTTSSGSSTSWASGNNTFAKSLCNFNTDKGIPSGYLKPAAPLGNYAAGNMFYGQFSLSGTTGTARFGQAFTWTSRPRTFKVKYSATVGKADYTGDHLSSGEIDPGRIYFAIVDWSDRHAVSSGTSAPTGCWDPASQTSTDKGAIIGYASMFITESQSALTQLELDIHYYDIETKPSGAIGIVISCATSNYGDYLEGSTSNRLYVGDFELGY